MLKTIIIASIFFSSISQGFYSGLNMPWNACGNDYGSGSFDYGSFNEAFSRYASSGASVVRVWIHYDGNKSLQLFDHDGYFKVLPQEFYNDFKNMLQIARDKNLKLFLTLFSFEIVNFDNTLWMMKDENKLNSYLNNGLSSLLDFINNEGFGSNILAVEVLNEPEWMVTGGSGVQRTTDLGSIQHFLSRSNQVITSKGFQATVGSASLKWSCNCGTACEGNWWGNTGISFYTVHYYDWMVGPNYAFDPFNTSPSDWCLDKQALVGESPSWKGKSAKGDINAQNQYYLAHSHGWMGVLPWSDKAQANWGEIQAGLQCQYNWDSCKPYFALESHHHGHHDHTKNHQYSSGFLKH